LFNRLCRFRLTLPFQISIINRTRDFHYPT
jgi:hypothetical protein